MERQLRPPKIHDWDLLGTNMGRLLERQPEVAVLPVGATEPHNRHLPEGQDVLHVTAVARRICAEAHEAGAAVICLPTIPFGVECNLMDFPLAIHVSQPTLDAMVREVVLSLARHAIRKVVLLNGHGGNEFGPLARQIQCDCDSHLFLCNWWTVGFDKFGEIFEAADDHAGEMETSVALALFPELVEMERAGDGRARPFALEALRRGWVRASRRFSRLNDQCAVGDPSRADAGKGRAYLDLVCGRLSAFLVELAAATIDEPFPQQP